MFNVGAFNLINFNLPVNNFVYGQGSLAGIGEITADAKYEIIAAIGLNGVGTLSLTISQGGEVVMSGVGELSAAAFKELFIQLALAGIGELSAEANAYIVESLTFTGAFAANNIIVIDSDNFTIKLNGVNVMTELTAGDFFNLKSGTNTIKYTDAEGSRTVKIDVKKRDRWL